MSTRYYIDEEFIDDGKNIDLISIGIVSEDGRELYCQSVEFNAYKASEWVQNNVFPGLSICPYTAQIPSFMVAMSEHRRIGKCTPEFHLGNSDVLYPGYITEQIKLGNYQECPWRTRKQIKDEILTFMDIEKYGKPEICSYYGAYDHVAFCQLFGTMMDLPKGFPMYTMDLKQWCKMLGDPQLPEQGKGSHNALEDARWNKLAWEFLGKTYQYRLWENDQRV